MLTEEKREELRRLAEFAKEHVRKGMASRDEVDRLARGVLALLGERMTDAEAGAIQAVSEVETLRRENAELRRIGAQMANVCFNLGQDASPQPTAADQAAMLALTKAWDALRPSGRVFTEAEVREAGADLFQRYTKRAKRNAADGMPTAAETCRQRAVGVAEMCEALDVKLD